MFEERKKTKQLEGSPAQTHTMPPMEVDTVLSALREGTKDIHDRLETAITINVAMQRNVIDKALTPHQQALVCEQYRRTYREYLLLVLLLEKSFEAAIDDSQGGCFLREQLHREPAILKASELILRDLDKTGGIPNTIEDIFTTSRFLVPAQDLATAAGYEYVRTGSRLGGKVLASKVRMNLGYDETNGASYLTMGGSSVKKEFTQLMETLSPLSSNAVLVQKAVSGARAAFAAADECFRLHKSIDNSTATPIPKKPSRLAQLLNLMPGI